MIGKRIEQMELEHIHGLMVILMMGNGSLIRSMGKGLTSFRMEIAIMGII